MTSKDENVIKNPARKEHYSVEKYVPEYVRLNKEPQVENVDKVELRTLANRKKKRKLMETKIEVPNNNILRITDPFSLPQETEDKIPAQLKLNIGNDKNWLEDPVFDKTYNKELDVEDFDEEDVEPEEKNETSAGETSVFDCVPGTYVLFVEKEAVFSSTFKEEIEVKIEEILFVDQKYKNINVNDIFILKKVPVRIGAVLME